MARSNFYGIVMALPEIDSPVGTTEYKRIQEFHKSSLQTKNEQYREVIASLLFQAMQNRIHIPLGDVRISYRGVGNGDARDFIKRFGGFNGLICYNLSFDRKSNRLAAMMEDEREEEMVKTGLIVKNKLLQVWQRYLTSTGCDWIYVVGKKPEATEYSDGKLYITADWLDHQIPGYDATTVLEKATLFLRSVPVNA